MQLTGLLYTLSEYLLFSSVLRTGDGERGDAGDDSEWFGLSPAP